MEPIRIAMSLDDLGTAQVDVPIARPDGSTVVVALRPLSEGEVFALRRGITWPTPPVKDMTKSGPVYDYSAPSYLDAMREANRRLTYLVLLAMLPFDVAGDDADAKLETLRSKLGQYAYIQLAQAASRLNSIGDEEIAETARAFRSGRDASPSGNGAAGVGAGTVAGAVEGGSG